MEVACGEYGDMVPRLVVAVKSDQCSQFQCYHKLTNCDNKGLVSYVADIPETDKMKPADGEVDESKETCEGVSGCDELDGDAIVAVGSTDIQMTQLSHNIQQVFCY